jgi:hypothetical protein
MEEEEEENTTIRWPVKIPLKIAIIEFLKMRHKLLTETD